MDTTTLSDIVPVIAIIIAFIALIVSYLAYSHSKHSRRSSIITELVQQADTINEAIARYEIRGPYAVLLKIKSSDDIKKFGALAAVFFHHIQLLNMVYRNREYLGKDVEDTYKKWVSNIFVPWLESDQKLIEMWNLSRESKDLVGKDFMDWLEPQLSKIAKENTNADST